LKANLRARILTALSRLLLVVAAILLRASRTLDRRVLALRRGRLLVVDHDSQEQELHWWRR